MNVLSYLLIASIILLIYLILKNSPRISIKYSLYDAVFINNDFWEYHDKIIQWFNNINAVIIKDDFPNNIIAEHSEVITSTEFTTSRYWNYNIKIEIKQLQKGFNLYVNFEPSLSYSHHPSYMNAFLRLRDLLMSLYNYLNIYISQDHLERIYQKSVLDELIVEYNHIRILLFLLIIFSLLDAAYFLIYKMYVLFFGFILFMFFIGLIFGLINTEYLTFKSKKASVYKNLNSN